MLGIRDTGTWRDLTTFGEFPELEFLDIGASDSDHQLVSLNGIERLRRLRVVSFVGLKGLTDISALTKLDSLEYLELRGCTGLSKDSIDSLKAALPGRSIRVM